MNNKFWTALGICMIVAVVALVVASLTDSLPSQKRKAACEKAGGVYLYREGVCMRKDLVLELL